MYISIVNSLLLFQLNILLLLTLFNFCYKVNSFDLIDNDIVTYCIDDNVLNIFSNRLEYCLIHGNSVNDELLYLSKNNVYEFSYSSILMNYLHIQVYLFCTK